MAGPWLRVQSIVAPAGPGTAGSDFLAVLPAASLAARRGRPFVACWLCRARGAPLEFITNAVFPGPALAGRPAEPRALLFPPGARGVPAAPGWLAACERLAWAPCPGRLAPPLVSGPAPGTEPSPLPATRFESALAAIAGRPFGWLVVAEPTDLLDAEVAELRAQVTVLRRHDEERFRFGTERAERRLAELDDFREAGLWLLRVLVGAASAAELARIGPVLAGSADLGLHPYRLGACLTPRPLAEALAAEAGDRGPGPLSAGAGDGGPGPLAAGADDGGAGARVPLLATAGLLAALAGLPQREVPGLRILEAGQFDVTSETGTSAGPAESAPALRLGSILDAQDRPVGEFLVPLAALNRHA